LFYNKDKLSGFRIGKHAFYDMKKQPALYCPFCEKIIIDCKE